MPPPLVAPASHSPPPPPIAPIPPPVPRPEELSAALARQRPSTRRILALLAQHLWPRESPAIRLRVVLAAVLLVASKVGPRPPGSPDTHFAWAGPCWGCQSTLVPKVYPFGCGRMWRLRLGFFLFEFHAFRFCPE